MLKVEIPNVLSSHLFLPYKLEFFAAWSAIEIRCSHRNSGLAGMKISS